MTDLVAIRHFSEPGFWAKLARHALAAGRAVCHKALCLYYASMSSETPAWARAAIAGALGYFILPLDSIPDFVPLAGYSDDLATLTLAAATVAAHVKPEHVARADAALSRWLAASPEAQAQ